MLRVGQVPGRFLVMEKASGEFVANVEAPEAFFITHTLGAYEEDSTGLLHFDVLQYRTAEPYTKAGSACHRTNHADNDWPQL